IGHSVGLNRQFLRFAQKRRRQYQAQEQKPPSSEISKKTSQSHFYSSSRRACVNSVPDERERAPGLAPMLGTKSEEHDAAFAHGDFGECDLVFDLILTTQPAGSEYFVFRVACDHVNLIAIGCFEG